MSTGDRATYMTEKLGPLPFCPGCGHHLITRALDRALVKLQPDPKKVVIVTDIGCVGLSDRYFITNAFHGLHGRSVTYACGLKLARPELTVIVIQGDGGTGIGGAHLLNVARRNIGITLIVGNNLNYGMTGGQHSVTTPTGGLTSTTPDGNVESPIDLCATVAAAGGSWVYRATAFDKDLPEVMAQAIAQPGFAFLDVWELCTAYYSPQNKLTKNDIFRLIETYGFERGLIADKPRPEYSERIRPVHTTGGDEPRESVPIEREYLHHVAKQTGIIIAGSAGQKIQSNAAIFAESAMLSGLEVTQKNDYPITVMTGHSLSELILSPERIDYTEIEVPDFLLVVSEDGVKRTRPLISRLPERCSLIADASLEIPDTAARILRLPLTGKRDTSHAPSPVIMALSAMLKESDLFPVEAFEAGLSRFQKTDRVQRSLEALRAGVKLIVDRRAKSF